jgi:hypothetical protein
MKYGENEWGGDKSVSICKISRLCPVVLWTDLRLREGEALGSEEGKMLGSGFHEEQRKRVEQGLCCICSEFLLMFEGL